MHIILQQINYKFISFLYFMKKLHIFFIILLIFAFILKIKFFPSYAQLLIYQNQQITISRNQGIPFIKSKTKNAFFFALGYVTAQDRLFQMHLRRTIAQGKLSQMIGNKTIEIDIFFRQLGLKYLADKITKRMKNQDQITYKLWEAYNEGINKYIQDHGLPLQFYLLWTNPDKWIIQDFISIAKLAQFSMGMNIQQQYVRSILMKNYTIQQIKILFPYEQDKFFMFQKNKYTINDDQLKNIGLFKSFHQQNWKLDKLLPQQLQNIFHHGIIPYLDLLSDFQGSNAFIIDGNYTVNEKPLFAADPHLDNSMPSQWFQAQALFYDKGKQIRFKGIIFAGAPHMFMGKNEYMTWGCTVTKTDTQDLYLQRLDERRENYYFENEWRKLKIRDEVIRIKGGIDIVYKVRETHRGPILSRLISRSNFYNFNDSLSVAWSNYNDEYEYYKNANQIYHIKDIQNFTNYLTHFLNQGPNVNILFATTDNHIGFFMINRIPIRSHPQTGAFIKDGTISQYDWKGFYKGINKPYLLDPKKGYIINSNNKPASLNYQSGIYRFSVTPTARINRIQEMINEKMKVKKLTIEDIKQIQLDVTDVYCRQLIQNLYEYLPQLKQYLKDWKCKFNSDSYQASIYQVLFAKLKKRKNKSELPLQSFLIFDHYILNYLKGNTKQQINIIQLKQLFQITLKYLEDKFKTKDYTKWKWGTLHRDYYPSKIFGNTPLKSLFQRSFIGRGNINTVNMGLMQKQGEDNYDINIKANARLLDSFQQNGSFWIIDGGASQNIFSRYYDNMLEKFSKQEYISYDLSRVEVEEQL